MAWVQSATNLGTSAGGGTFALTFGAPIGAGSLLVLTFGWAAAVGATPSVTDNATGATNSYTLLPLVLFGGEGWNVAYCTNVQGAPTVFTANAIPGSTITLFVGDEYSGPYGFVTSAAATGTGSTTLSVGPVTTGTSNCLLYASGVNLAGSGATAGAGYTTRVNNFSSANTTSDIIQSSPGSYSTTYTIGGSASADLWLLAFSPPSVSFVSNFASSPSVSRASRIVG